MKKQKITPRDAISFLTDRGYSFADIGRLLDKPANYPLRVQSGVIKEPSFLVVDVLRKKVEEIQRQESRQQRS